MPWPDLCRQSNRNGAAQPRVTGGNAEHRKQNLNCGNAVSRHTVERTEQRRRLARRQAERADALAFDEPADDLAADSDLQGPPGLDRPQPRKERPRRTRQAAGTELAWGA